MFLNYHDIMLLLMNIIKTLGFLFSLVLSSSVYATDFGKCNLLFPHQTPPTITTENLNTKHTKPLCYEDFAILYSIDSKTPVYTVERLNYLGLSQKKPKRPGKFHEEPMLSKSERSTLKDYARSGYDRGHNAPCLFRRGEVAMEQSMNLANCMPQRKRHNEILWAKNVERATYNYILKRSKGDVFVFTGSYYYPTHKTIGENHVWVPDVIWKVVDDSGGKRWVFWTKNSDDEKMSPPISYEAFVAKTGLHLLP